MFVIEYHHRVNWVNGQETRKMDAQEVYAMKRLSQVGIYLTSGALIWIGFFATIAGIFLSALGALSIVLQFLNDRATQHTLVNTRDATAPSASLHDAES
jgi:uncharacterized membrane protein